MRWLSKAIRWIGINQASGDPKIKVHLHQELGLFLTQQPVFVVSGLVTGFIVSMRLLGWFQNLDVVVYDQMMRWQPPASTDTRLLIVGITEADIATLQQYPLSDRVLAQALTALQRYQPKAIGLDIYRDIPQPPGQTQLLEQLQAPNVIVIESYGGISAPASVPKERVGFNDLLLDPDGVVRRNFLFTSWEGEEYYSFSLRLSLQYLSSFSVSPVPFRVDAHALQIDNAVFRPLEASAGGYETIDDLGYQTLLRYRTANPFVRQVSLSQVLNGEIEADWIKDKVVLIGTTAPSGKDIFFTPHTGADREHAAIPGVVIHAQMVSQILSAVLDGRSPFRFWADWAEALWILGWSVLGGIGAWRLQHPVILGISGAVAITGLVGSSFILFLNAVWVPVAPALAALVATEVMLLSYRRLYDASHDVLTRLPNRAKFTRSLQQALLQARGQAHSELAVLWLGLDRFKVVNESLGHQAGDQVLQLFVARLKQQLPSTHQLARVGGDEFAILLHALNAGYTPIEVASRLQTTLTQPIEYHKHQLLLTFSLGIALSQPDYSYKPDDLLRDAQIAMYHAKARGKAQHEVFAVGMHEQVLGRMQLETDLRRAIEHQEFVLHYQPIVSLETGQIAGFEALVRWQHPQQGMIAPSEFIPVAEDTGLIVPLGRWILEAACRQMHNWHNLFPAVPLLISVNLSPAQFVQPNLVQEIEDIIQNTGLNPQSLKLEITESMMMERVEEVIAVLLKLKSLHLKLGIDDFGTGYSSLSYLHRFPVDTLKVDRSFVNRMEEVGSNAEIVHTIINLGHSLGLNVIAEGVEQQIQLDMLRQLGCEYAQGYFLAKPLTSEAATALLQEFPQW